MESSGVKEEVKVEAEVDIEEEEQWGAYEFELESLSQ